LIEAFVTSHLRRHGEDVSLELGLRGLELEVAYENPRQRARQEQADGDDARGRGEEAEPQVQLPASSNR
jgi:hypothetical protein